MGIVITVMNVVLITYSLIVFTCSTSEYLKPRTSRRWSGKRVYYLCTFYVWGAGFLLVGLTGFSVINPIAYTVWGIGWFLMIFAPCSTPIFNENTYLWFARASFFAATGITCVLITLLPTL